MPRSQIEYHGCRDQNNSHNHSENEFPHCACASRQHTAGASIYPPATFTRQIEDMTSRPRSQPAAGSYRPQTCPVGPRPLSAPDDSASLSRAGASVVSAPGRALSSVPRGLPGTGVAQAVSGRRGINGWSFSGCPGIRYKACSPSNVGAAGGNCAREASRPQTPIEPQKSRGIHGFARPW